MSKAQNSILGDLSMLPKLWVLMVTAFVEMIGFALVIPLLPLYAQRFGATATTIGFLMAAFALGGMIMAPIWGRVSDFVGRKPVMLAGQAIAACAFLVFAYADSVLLLFVCRFLQGVGAGSIGSINAYVSDAVEPAERAQALGWITACTSLGVMVGPWLASQTVAYSYAAPGLIAAGASVVNLVFTAIWLREMRDPNSRPSKPQGIRRQAAVVIQHPTRTVSSLIWVYTAGMMAFMAMTGMMALYLSGRFGITETEIGHYYMGLGAASFVMRALILGPTVRRFGEVRTLRSGALCLGIGMLGMGFAPNLWLFVVAMALAPIGTAFLFPSTTSLISRHSDPDEVGQTMGLQQAFGGISRLLAPIWAGFVFDRLGMAVPFWIGGAVVLSVGLLSLRLRPGAAPKAPPPDAPVDASADASTA